MHCLVVGWQVMASVEGNSQPAMSSSGSDVHPDASLSAVSENSVHKADAEARCMFICVYSFSLT